eukprot:366919_1
MSMRMEQDHCHCFHGDGDGNAAQDQETTKAATMQHRRKQHRLHFWIKARIPILEKEVRAHIDGFLQIYVTPQCQKDPYENAEKNGNGNGKPITKSKPNSNTEE